MSRKPLNLFAKFITILLAAVFVIIGLVGLLIPVIPGIVFLALALLIVARLIPPLERLLRRNPTLNDAHDRLDRYQQLSFKDKCSYIAWSTAKLVCDVAALGAGLVRRIGRSWSRQVQDT